MSKRDILELYMNSINLGQNTLGVQAASMRYFNKPVSELNLSECAVIAGITQNPSKYNPITHPEDNADRRTKVLNDMLDQGWIDQDEYDEAMADDVYSRIKQVNETTESDSINSYFVDALIDQVTSVLMEERAIMKHRHIIWFIPAVCRSRQRRILPSRRSVMRFTIMKKLS